jgi:hypothetical protein
MANKINLLYKRILTIAFDRQNLRMTYLKTQTKKIIVLEIDMNVFKKALEYISKN